MNKISFTIAGVEKETGLSKDILRMWERRYGFPTPERDANGDRVYPAEQVERLRRLKRLIDQGHRPGKLFAASPEQLAALAIPPEARCEDEGTLSPFADLLDELRQHDAAAFQQRLQHMLARQGLASFVRDTVAPLIVGIGQEWETGRIAVFEEHLFTELTKRVLRQSVAGLAAGITPPRVLLTTVPDEPHELGLLMVEALFALEGAQCVPLGVQMPLAEIANAATAHQADIVALSFSRAFPARRIPAQLVQLRAMLPESAMLWAGGSGVSTLDTPAGTMLLRSLDDGLGALAAWRIAHGEAGALFLR
jgi:MerR family transcriptional regulator, light-induced transcriptional regulator